MNRISMAIAVLLGLGLALTSCTPPPPAAKTVATVISELQPHYRIFKPAGNGPFPTVILMHGASDRAWFPVYEGFAKEFQEAGYAAVWVDAYSGRGISGHAIRGGTLLPAERAADIYATLDWLKSQAWVRRDAIGVIGWSHGAATIMDALVLNPPAKLPTGLTDLPNSTAADLKGAVLIYPWCSGSIAGFELLKAVENDWTAETPVLGLIATSDSVTDHRLCREILERHGRQGRPVEIVTFEAGHNFDMATDDYGKPWDTYSPEIKAQSRKQMFRFLARNLR